MAYKKYSDMFVQEAMIKLAINKYNYDKTAEDLGEVTPRTLRNWEKDFVKKGIPELLERSIERMLMVIPQDMKARDWAISLGILMDKWLLAQGMATSRTENLFQSLNDMPDEELNELVRQFEEHAITRNAESGTGKAKK